MARKASTTIRITEEARELLKQLAVKLGVSQAAVMEMAIRKLAQQEGGGNQHSEIGTLRRIMKRQTAEQQIREMLKEVYEEGDVNAATIFKGNAHDTFDSGWHLRFFGRHDHIFMGKSVAEAGAYCDDIRSNRETDPSLAGQKEGCNESR